MRQLANINIRDWLLLSSTWLRVCILHHQASGGMTYVVAVVDATEFQFEHSTSMVAINNHSDWPPNSDPIAR